MKTLLILSTCLFLQIPGFCQWNKQPLKGNLLANSPGYKWNFISLDDGFGGMITLFITDSSFQENGNDVIMRKLNLQRVRKNGSLAWGDSLQPAIAGADISPNFETGFKDNGTFLAMAPDGKGGAFVAWAHGGYVFYPPRIQHIDSTGQALWGTNGVLVTPDIIFSFQNGMPHISLVRSGSGVIMSWNAKRNAVSSDTKMWVQRFDENGVPLWGANGKQIVENTGIRAGSLVTDGKEGVIAIFNDTRNVANGVDIFAQRIDSNGIIFWNGTGVPVCTRAGNQEMLDAFTRLPNGNYSIADGAGGAIISFRDDRNFNTGNYDVYAQKIDSSGQLKWLSSGVPVTTQTERQETVSMARDSRGGAFVLLFSGFGYNDAPYLQRLDGLTGQRLFTDFGKPVSYYPSPDIETYTSMAADTSGNVFTSTWAYETYNNAKTHLTLRRFDSTGQSSWDSAQLNYIAPGVYPVTRMVAEPDGTAILTWSEFSPPSQNIRAIKIKPGGVYFPEYTATQSGNWNDPAIWEDGQVPDENSMVVIKSSVTVTADASCYSLKLEAGGNVQVNAGVHFTVLH